VTSRSGPDSLDISDRASDVTMLRRQARNIVSLERQLAGKKSVVALHHSICWPDEPLAPNPCSRAIAVDDAWTSRSQKHVAERQAIGVSEEKERAGVMSRALSPCSIRRLVPGFRR